MKLVDALSSVTHSESGSKLYYCACTHFTVVNLDMFIHLGLVLRDTKVRWYSLEIKNSLNFGYIRRGVILLEYYAPAWMVSKFFTLLTHRCKCLSVSVCQPRDRLVTSPGWTLPLTQHQSGQASLSVLFCLFPVCFSPLSCARPSGRSCSHGPLRPPQ